MALSATTIWEFNVSATASMVNGGGFNSGNANFLTDLTTDTNTANTNSPVVSSASYNFVAGDVGAWVYIKSGTNWTPGLYQIASVATNKATLSAAIGEAMQLSSTTGEYAANTVAGCATVGTPTGGTFSVDYSQSTAAILTKTDLTCTAGSTTISSATATFTPVMIGNIVHLTALTGTGAIIGWYEIVSYVSATSVVLDRTPTDGVNNITSGTYFVGGSLSLNSTLDDDFMEAVIGGNIIYFKNGNYTLGEAVAVASTSSTTTNPVKVIGYDTLRSSNAIGANRPTIAQGTNYFAFGVFWIIRNFIFNGAVAGSVVYSTAGNSAKWFNIKVSNTATTSSRIGITLSADSFIGWSEAVSQSPSGIAINSATSAAKIYGCYVHDSDNGISLSSNRYFVSNSVIEACDTAGLSLSGSLPAEGVIFGNTIYGTEEKRGTGILLAASHAEDSFINNIIYGWTNGISQTTSQLKSNMGFYNDFYNNTTDISNYSKSYSDLALDPQFVGATQITGTTATTSGSVLTQSGGDFSTVTDNIDYLHVVSGTGVTVGRYLITSHTGTTLTTNNALGTSSGGDVVYYVTTGHNFAIGTNLKAQGFPGLIGTETTSYLDKGAVQRQESTSSGSTGFFIQ